MIKYLGTNTEEKETLFRCGCGFVHDGPCCGYDEILTDLDLMTLEEYLEHCEKVKADVNTKG